VFAFEKKAVGYDGAHSSLSRLLENITSCTILGTNSPCTIFEEESFDVLSSCFAFCAAEVSHWSKSMRIVSHILRPGGYIVMTLVSSDKGKICSGGKHRPMHDITASEIRGALDAEGFEDIDLQLVEAKSPVDASNVNGNAAVAARRAF